MTTALRQDGAMNSATLAALAAESTDIRSIEADSDRRA